MANIRFMAAAATIIVALSFAPATARTCDSQEGCNAVSTKSQAAPIRLSQFMTHPARPAKTANPAATKPQSNTPASSAKPRTRVAKSAPQPKPAAPQPDADVPAAATAELSRPPRTIETDGVAVASSDEVNEIDAAADKVQVVAANEVNEIDLAADAPAPVTQAALIDQSTPTAESAAMTAMASADQPPADRSWIAKLFVALGGIVAVASAARLLIA